MCLESVLVLEAHFHADTLEVSYHSSPIEYCCQLWNPWKTKDIQSIETIQLTFTNKLAEVQHLNYMDEPAQLK